jgi:hypothetical protein
MISFKEFCVQENLWGNIPGNPAWGGKKPSDGRGSNPMNSNTPNQTQGQSQPLKMMKKGKTKNGQK